MSKEFSKDDERWRRSPAYRMLLSSMAKVRWLTHHNRIHRPDGAHDVKLLMERLSNFVSEDTDLDYAIQLEAMSDFVRLPVHELRYLADVGEWIEVDRNTFDLDDDDYEKFWKNDDNIPSMRVLRTSMISPLSDEDMKEVAELNHLYYGVK